MWYLFVNNASVYVFISQPMTVIISWEVLPHIHHQVNSYRDTECDQQCILKIDHTKQTPIILFELILFTLKKKLHALDIPFWGLTGGGR